jgi:hypothetical protein
MHDALDCPALIFIDEYAVAKLPSLATHALPGNKRLSDHTTSQGHSNPATGTVNGNSAP